MDSTNSLDKKIEQKKRYEKVEKILNHQVTGEVYISPPFKTMEAFSSPTI